MQYCFTVWGCNIRAINTMNKLQRRVSNIISRYNPDRSDISKLEKWLSFENRLKYQTAVIVYKSENGQAPKYIDRLLMVSTNNSYHLRSETNRNLILPKFNTELFKHSFTYISINIWNNLPMHIRQISNLKSFKRALISHLQQDPS